MSQLSPYPNQQRSNYHVENNIQVHIFCKKKEAPVLKGLQKQLNNKQYSYQFHQDPSELEPLIYENSRQKKMVIVCTEGADGDADILFDKNQRFPFPNEMVKIYTFPNKMAYTSLININNTKQLLQNCQSFFGTNQRKIVLASVHSIKGSKDKKIQSSRSLQKIITNSTYSTVFYRKDVENEYMPQQPASKISYGSLIEAIDGQANFQPFKSASDLDKKDAPKDKKKYLVIASTNDNSLRVIKDLKKLKKKYFQYALFGDLNSKYSYLDDDVIFASKDPYKFIQFLMENGYTSYSLSNLLLKFKSTNNLLTIPANSMNNGNNILNIVNSFQAESKPVSIEQIPFQSPHLSRANLTEESERNVEKKKIRKIKSPTKSRETEQLKNNDKIIPGINLAQSKAVPIESYEYSTRQPISTTKIDSNQQLNRSNQNISISKKELNNNIYPNSDLAYSNNHSFETNISSVPIDQFSKKKIGIDNKYKNNPSTIIQEVSEEYRGSNRESIMNIEPEGSRLRTNKNSYLLNGQSSPLQENTAKKTISMTSNLYNQPDRHIQTVNENKHFGIKVHHATTITSDNDSNYLPYMLGSTSGQSVRRTILQSSKNKLEDDRYIVPKEIYRNSSEPINVNDDHSYNSNVKVVRTYGRNLGDGFQSPSKVVRKQIISAPLEINNNEQSRNQSDNRITFAQQGYTSKQNSSYGVIPNNLDSNTRASTSNNNNFYRINNNNDQKNNYYNVQTSNYHNINNQPYSKKIEISTGKIQQYTPSTSTNQNLSKKDVYGTYNIGNNEGNVYSNANTSNNVIRYASPSKYETTTKMGNNEGNVNGNTNTSTNVIRYASPSKYETTTNEGNAYGNSNTSNNVIRYASPSKNETATKGYTTTGGIDLSGYDRIERDGKVMYTKKVTLQPTNTNYTNKIQTSTYSRKDQSPRVKRYEVSPSQRQNLTTYRYVSSQNNTSNNPKYHVQDSPDHYRPDPNIYSSGYQSYHINNKAQDNQYGTMIESSHKRQDPKFVTVSYRAEERNSPSVSSNYNVYGKNVNVNENNALNYKNEWSNSNRYNQGNNRMQYEHKVEYEHIQPKVQAMSPIGKPNILNESNWFSRMSELHSDGSILRKNNIRFGIKPRQKRQDKMEKDMSVMSSKMMSGIYKVNDLNKQMALNRVIHGQQFIEEQREKYYHINTCYNNFHYLVQEEMSYLNSVLDGHIASSNDRIDNFTGTEELFSCLSNTKMEVDIGFIFIKQEELVHINPSQIPEQYFFVVLLKEQEGVLEINELCKRIKIDNIKYLPLAKKILVDSKLYQYVAYTNKKKDVETVADKFINSEFILEKIETEFTTQILDCYYYELPRLTRVYLLCDEQQLAGMLRLIANYEDQNPAFNRQSCKVICILNSILNNDHLIMDHPSVTFISNPQNIHNYHDILNYAHPVQEDRCGSLPTDLLFYHNRHSGLEENIEKAFPGRFTQIPYANLTEAYRKIEKANKLSSKSSVKSYLVLHESVNGEKVRMEYFSKVYMLGKSKLVQSKVVRVMNSEELKELLRK